MAITPSSYDQNLVLGMLALQCDFVTQRELIEAMQAWMIQKEKPLGNILLERGAISAELHRSLGALVAEHIRRHGNDPQKSLAAFQPPQGLRDQLRALGDPQVSQIISSLPRARSDEGQPVGMFTLPHSPQTSAGVPRRFEVLRPLAEGGLGIVSVANDTEVVREVALKEIKPRFADDANSRARFMQEAEITGRLEHPCIVPVYGLGIYPDGRPYYAMRMIRGQSLHEAISEFHAIPEGAKDAGRRMLALRELLQRFIDVCNALEYAHSRGIVHRDLKPANIMLGKFRETLVVDWGLAKAIGQRDETARSEETAIVPELGGESLPTRLGEIVGTVAFMSPEQAAGRQSEVGPLSDLYSLGATLYQLLTSVPSQTGAELGKLLRNIQEGRFPRPREIKSFVPRPLEAICLRAMALRPADRYPSAAALASDLEHYLGDEPIKAFQESTPMRARRWLRKHPKTIAALVATTAMGIASLAGFGVLTQAHNRQLNQANEELEARRKEAVTARAKAEDARGVADTVKTFMLNAFKSADPEQDGKTVTVYEVLTRQAAREATDYQGPAEIGIEINRTFAELLGAWGLHREGVPLLEKALELAKASHGDEDPSTRQLAAELDVAYAEAGQFDKAIPQYQRKYEQALQEFGEADEKTLNALNNLASTFQKAERWEDSLRLLQKGKELVDAKFEKHDPARLAITNNALSNYERQGRMDWVLPLRLENLNYAVETWGENDPNSLIGRFNLAVSYLASGKMDDALREAQRTLELRRAKLGPEHPDLIPSLRLLLEIHLNRREFRDAETAGQACLVLLEQQPRRDDLTIAKVQTALAESLLSQGKKGEAATFLKTALNALTTKLKETSPERLRAENLTGFFQAKSKRWEDARKRLTESYQKMRAGIRRDFAPQQRWLIARACEHLVELYQDWDQPAEAAKWTEELDRLNAEIERLRNGAPEP